MTYRANKNLPRRTDSDLVENLRNVKYIYRDNIWGADLADMQLISKYNNGVRFLLFVIYIYSKYALVVPLRDQKSLTITNAFQKLLDEFGRKPNKICVDQGSEFYNKSLKLCLHDDCSELYSAHNEGKSVVEEKSLNLEQQDLLAYDCSIKKYVY